MRVPPGSATKPIRLIGVLVLAVWTVLYPLLLSAQTAECDYPKGRPSIGHARQAYRAAELECAALELNDLLNRTDTPRAIKAEAHMILASVYYVSDEEPGTSRNSVKKELVEMFMADRYWQGRLEIQTADFRKLVNDAHELAEWRYRNSPELAAEYDRSVERTDSLVADSIRIEESKPGQKKWYTKWWAIGSGVGIIAMAAILMSGGNDTGGSVPIDSLPPFPDTP